MGARASRTPDFERYARDSAHVERRFDFRPECVAAMRAQSGTYLDLGAGDGAILRSAYDAGLLDRFREIVAVDVSQERVARMQRENFARARCLVADAGDLRLDDASIDFVFSHQVIEHVPSDDGMASEIARVLKPGGAAFVTSVAKRPYGWYFYRCGGKWRLDPTHVREYDSVADLAATFARHGLRVRSAL